MGSDGDTEVAHRRRDEQAGSGGPKSAGVLWVRRRAWHDALGAASRGPLAFVFGRAAKRRLVAYLAHRGVNEVTMFSPVSSRQPPA